MRQARGISLTNKLIIVNVICFILFEAVLMINPNSLDYLALKPYSQHPSSINKQAIDLNAYDEILSEFAKKYSTKHFKVIYRKQSAEELESEISYDTCYGINFFALIDALGNIIPCNLFYEKEDYYYGNINKNKFSEIWKNNQRKAVVEKLYKEGCAKCRKGCRLNYINKYLYTLKKRDIEHINFI